MQKLTIKPLVIIGLIYSYSVSAQEHNSFLESRIGTWVNGPMEYYDMNENLAPDSGITISQNYQPGLSFGLNRSLNNDFTATAEIVWGSASVLQQLDNREYYSTWIKRAAIMVGGEYVYYRRAPVALYARLALGVNVYGENSKVELAYHVTPYGLRVGDALACFFEIGWGYAGIARVGMAIRMDKKNPANQN